MTMAPNLRRGLAGLLLAGAASVTTLPAANGDIPIFQATTITKAGRYVVTHDLSAQGVVVEIQASGVTVDLNGHTIGSTAGTGILINLAGLIGPESGIALLNGRIVGGYTGIEGINLPAGWTLNVERVQIGFTGNACIDVGFTARLNVHSSWLVECGADGIRMTGNGPGVLEIEDTLITDVQGSGIFASGIEGVVVRASTIRRFGLDGNEAGGVRVVAPGKLGLSVRDSVLGDGSVRGAGLLLELTGIVGPNDIVGNQIAGNGGSGIDLRQGAARITGNTIAANLGDGIRVDSVGIVTPSMILGNSILDSALNGTDIRAGVVRFNGNTVGGNLLDGVRVGGLRALVESNFLQGNGGAGLIFLNGPTHAYRSNFARGNTGGDIQDLFGNTDGGGNIK